VSFFACMALFYRPVQGSGRRRSRSHRPRALDRVQELVDMPREAPDVAGAVTLPPLRESIRVEGLRVSLGDKEVLKGLDLEIGRGSPSPSSAQRRRQDHAAAGAPAARRADRGPHPRGRRRRSRPRRAPRCARSSPGSARSRCCTRIRSRRTSRLEDSLSEPALARLSASLRDAGALPFVEALRKAGARASPRRVKPSRPASVSGSRSRGRSIAMARCSCSTSRRRRSTACGARGVGGAREAARDAHEHHRLASLEAPCGGRSASSCSKTAASSRKGRPTCCCEAAARSPSCSRSRSASMPTRRGVRSVEAS